jgi:hypothetical protein
MPVVRGLFPASQAFFVCPADTSKHITGITPSFYRLENECDRTKRENVGKAVLVQILM